MHHRSASLTALSAFVVVILIAIFSTALPASSSPRAQGNPTEQQQTIDAIVQQRFTQTAAVEQVIGQTQTAEAATLFAPTLTAAFNATIDAAFNQALTATADAAFAATSSAVSAQYGPALDALTAIANAKDAAIQDWLTSSGRNLDAAIQQADLLALASDAQAGALSAAASQYDFGALALFDLSGNLLATTDAALTGQASPGALVLAADGTAATVQPVFPDAARGGAPSVVVSRPVRDASGAAQALLVGWPDLSALDGLLTAQDVAGWPVQVALVSAATHSIFAPANLADGRALSSDGITHALSGQSGSGLYANADPAPQMVVAVYRWEAALQAALLVEVPQSQAGSVPVPTATALPASATPQPEIFPTNVVADVQMVEQVYEHGRMFWLRHNREIWVMVNVPADNTAGDWYCYNDTFIEGDPEIDPNLTPPEGLYQPRRGFGTLWRNHPDLKTALGWAVTPEFELTSHYTYIAGGYVQNDQYVPGPGEHRLTTFSSESISFFEREVRGDCLGGTWRLAQ